MDSVRRPPTTLTEQEQLLLLRVTGAHVAGWRDHCLYSLALGAGLREHEIVALDIGDLYDAAGHAKRRIVLRVFKGCKKTPAPPPQEVILPDAVRRKLDRLYELRRRAGEVLTPDTPVFVSRFRRRLSTRQVRHGFRVWQTRAGFERIYHFHVIRHSAATNVYRRSRDIRLTQQFCRHGSIDTTVIYTHTSAEDLLRVVQQIPS